LSWFPQTRDWQENGGKNIFPALHFHAHIFMPHLSEDKQNNPRPLFVVRMVQIAVCQIPTDLELARKWGQEYLSGSSFSCPYFHATPIRGQTEQPPSPVRCAYGPNRRLSDSHRLGIGKKMGARIFFRLFIFMPLFSCHTYS
jgi:hypothetical protein